MGWGVLLTAGAWQALKTRVTRNKVANSKRRRIGYSKNGDRAFYRETIGNDDLYCHDEPSFSVSAMALSSVIAAVTGLL